jgi:hypothetical protein
MDTHHADYRAELLPPENEYRVEMSLFVEGKLWTLNAERSDHYAIHRKRTREWREIAAYSALHVRVPRLAWATFHCVPFQERGVLADPGAHIGPAKATIDGLVDAGLLPDDNAEYVGGITLAAPRRPQAEMREGLLVLIVGRTK